MPVIRNAIMLLLLQRNRCLFDVQFVCLCVDRVACDVLYIAVVFACFFRVYILSTFRLRFIHVTVCYF